MVSKKDRKTSPSKNDAGKLKDSIQSNEIFADCTNIRLNFDKEDGCIHLIVRTLDQTQRDTRRRNVFFFKLVGIGFEVIERNFRKENVATIEVD